MAGSVVFRKGSRLRLSHRRLMLHSTIARCRPAIISGVLLLVGQLAFPKSLPARDLDPDETFVPQEVVEKVSGLEDVDEDLGWDFYLRTGFSASFSGSSNVIGALDGHTWTLGGSLHHGWYYITRLHEWRNDTRTRQVFASTPLIDDWVKSSDELDYLSMYFYRLPAARWVGPFGRFRLKTQLFPGSDVRPEEVTYVIGGIDGSERVVTADRLHLTDVFMPLTVRQTVGAFFQPETPPALRIEALVGFGARQTFADGQLAVTGDDPAALEVTELESFNQAGTELSLTLSGELDGGRFSYSAVAEIMTPFLNDLDAADERSAIGLTNIELKGTVSLRPYEWLSIDYQFQALREPQLLERFQVTNRLLISISYTLIERSFDLE